MSDFFILSDGTAATNADHLRFSRYSRPLINIITHPKSETPFTIGIFGSWGSGKSTLLRILDEKLQQDFSQEFIRIHFNPWLHRGEPNLLVPLLHTLHDTLQEDKTNRFLESAKKIGNVLLKLGADVFLKSVTANTVSLESLEKLEQSYLKERQRVESEIRRLRQTLQQEADKIAAKGARLIFFIDDLDRCDPIQIIDLLEAVKLFLDIRHVFIILAVDKEVIDRGIEVKYSKFKFGENRQAALGAEYLEKMVQLPLHLFPLHKTQVRNFITALNPATPVLDHLDLLERLLSPNPRKIKRIINILTVVHSIMQSTEGIENLNLNMELITRLVTLQVQSGELYSAIISQPDLLIALEGIYARAIDPDKPEDFGLFGDRAAVIQTLSKSFYRPDTYLAGLFEQSSFGAVKDQLSIYLSLLGG